MMKMPDSIRLQGIDFDIKQVPDLVINGNALWGCIKHGQSEIKISTNEQEHQKQCVTLWHELLHGICEMGSLSLGNAEETERAIDTLAYGIYQILEDNISKLYDIEEGKNNG